MYCQNCGKQIANGVRFCPECGYQNAPLQQMQTVSTAPLRSAVDAALEERRENIELIKRYLVHFLQKKDQYDEYDATGPKIDNLRKSRSVKLIIGIILIVVGAIGSLLFLDAIKEGRVFVGSFKDVVMNVSSDLFFSVGALFVGLILIREFKRDKAKRHKDLAACIERRHALIDELAAHYNGLGGCAVGIEYTNPRILEKILNLLRDGRADNTKEAINTMLDDAHKTEMELRARQIERNTAAAADAANRAAFFAAADFILN